MVSYLLHNKCVKLWIEVFKPYKFVHHSSIIKLADVLDMNVDRKCGVVDAYHFA
jgi:NADH:ubiquinone oxidoreductase subunit E